MATKKEATVTENIESVEQEAKHPVIKASRKYAPDDLIPCRSVTYGELLMTGAKSKLMYVWANYNDVTEVEFQDLQALKSTRSSYLFRPRFVIEDEELLEQWTDLRAIYDKAAAVDIDSLFSLPINQFKKRLRDLPIGMRDAIKNIAREKIREGTLDSLSKINAIDEILGTELRLMIE